jgi:hypothetical protein
MWVPSLLLWVRGPSFLPQTGKEVGPPGATNTWPRTPDTVCDPNNCRIELGLLAIKRKIHLMKFLSQLLFISAFSLLQGVQAEAQEPTKSLPKTKVVLRISRQFIHQLTGKQFKRDEPIDKNSIGTIVQGIAHAEGTFDVKLQKSASASDFDFLVKGEVLTQMVATSRRVQVHEHGVARFSGRQRVVFDGNAFTGQAIEMNAKYHSSLDQVCSFRGGLIGSVTRGIAVRTIRRSLPESDQEAENELRTRLTNAIGKETDEIIEAMNKFGPLLKKGEELLREEKVLSVRSVQQYLAATEEHLYLSIGPPEHRIPSLPKLDAHKGGPIEMWIAIEKASKDDLRNSVLHHWNIAKPFVLQRIGKDSPELAKIVEEIQVEVVEGWYVVTIAPQLVET